MYISLNVMIVDGIEMLNIGVFVIAKVYCSKSWQEPGRQSAKP